MKKYITLAALLFVAVIPSYGQDHGKSMMPDFTPPSPEAFKMTKYGDVPIDEFNGKVKLDIPLYNYTAGNLQLPIALNYYGAGVKVDDLPTQVGINWSLEAGGVITREIRDKVDETSIRPNLTDLQINALNNSDCTTEAGQLFQYLFSSSNDNQSDIFRFNFLNYSGSFYLDDNLRPVLVKNDQNLKIEIIGSLATNKTFRITDPNGIMYYFGGTSGCEETYNRTITGSDQQFSKQGITSFYLYEIKDPINGRIFFVYDSLAPHFIDISKSYSLTKSIAIDIGGVDGSGTCSSNISDAKNLSVTKLSIHNNKLLKKIYSENHNEVILFNRTMTDNEFFKSYLTSIEIKKGNYAEDPNGTLIFKSEFEYLGLENPATAQRFFLTKVMTNKSLQSSTATEKKYEEYRMEYDRPETLPDRFSTKIDMLGYFNGKTNLDLYPCFPNVSGGYAVGCPNRTADFNFSCRGALSKIYYPTGGHTNFEYEPQPGIVSGTQTIEGGLFFNQGAPSTLTGEVQNVPNIGRTAVILLTCSDYNEYGNHWAKFVLKITDLTVIPNRIRTEYASHGTKNYNYAFIPNHSYKIEYELVLPTSSNINGYGAEGSFSIAYPNSVIPTEGAGVRIKRINNVANGTATESKRRFYYKSYDKLNSIGADLFDFIPRQSISGTMRQCSVAGAMYPQKTQTLYSDYIASDYNCSEVKYKEYSTVTVSYGGDSFEQGGIEKTFKVSDDTGYYVLEPGTPRPVDAYQSNYPNSRHNTVAIDGLLLKEKTFKNTSGTVYKVMEKKYEYEYPLLAKKTNIFAYQLFDFARLPSIFEILVQMHISYVHNGFFDCLNPVFTNRCNCCSDYDGRIYNHMKAKMRDKLVAENSPLLANFNSNMDSGLWVIQYGFENDYTSAGIVLLEKIGICTPSNTLSNIFTGVYYTSSFDFKKTMEKEINYIDPVPANLVPVEYDGEVPPGYQTQEQLEAAYKKITTSQSYEYGTLKGLPKKITTETSENGISKIQKNYYANETSALAGLTPAQVAACSVLVSQNRIATPMQVENYQNTTLLNTQRTLYKAWNNNPVAVLPEIIQTAKGSAGLEDRAIFTSYTAYGNPDIVSLKNGTFTKYFYNKKNKVTMKIENYILPRTTFATPPANEIPIDDCTAIQGYPESMVTVYHYDDNTDQIISITAPDCQTTYYIYDEMHKLKYIKDSDRNIVQEFINNYKP